MTLWGGWVLGGRELAWFWMLLTLGVAVAAWRAYRTTVPPVGERRRKILLSLRLAALALLLLFASGLRLTWSGVAPRAPRVAVLVDESESMSFSDRLGSRPEAVREALAGPGADRLRSDADVHWLGFDGRVHETAPARLTFDGDATAIGTALLEQRRDVPPPDAVLLISDGANTGGPDPVRSATEIALPVYVIGVGDSLPQADARVAGVSAPNITLAGRPLTAKVTVENTGLPVREATLRLVEGGRTISQTNVTLPPSGRRVDAEITITPTDEGLKRYTVALDSVPGEAFARNNAGVFTTRVLRSQRKVLLLADAPGADIAFWMRFFARRGDWSVRTWFAPHPRRRSAPLALNPDSLRDTDLIIWHDVRPGALSTAQLAALRDAVRGGAGLIAVTVHHGLPLDWEAILSAEPERARYGESQASAVFTPEAQRHPVLSGDVDFPMWSQNWSALPPLLARNGNISPREGATTLLSADGVPLAVAADGRHGRVVVFGGATYWRWDMVPRGLGQTDTAGDAFWRAVVRWTGTRRPLSRVDVQADAPIYRLGEPARMTVRVYDENYAPLDGADVRVVVDSGAVAVTAVSQGDGRYAAEVTGLTPGEHTVSASARSAGTTLGTATGEVAIAEVGLEHEQPRQQRDVLEAIARAARSGGADAAWGAYVPVDRADSLLLSLPLNPILERRESLVRVGHSPWVLAGVILLLAAEWTIRRFSGLM